MFLALTGRPAEPPEDGDPTAGSSTGDDHEARRWQPDDRDLDDLQAGGAPEALASPDEEAIRKAISSTPRPSPPGRLSASLTFGWRGDAQGQARARAAARRHGHADHVRAAVHVPVRRRGGRVDGRVPGLPDPRHPRDVGAVHDRLLGRGAQHRHHQGRRRPLPLAADLAAGPAGRHPARRQRPLRAGGHGDHRAGRRRSATGRGAGVGGVVAALALVVRLLVRPVVGLHGARPAAAHARAR